MNDWVSIIALAALLGSGLIGGVFFAFSSFIMKALARVPSAEGIRAMQSINVVVINPMFLGAFIGTALLSAVMALLVLTGWSGPLPHWFFVGALLYVFGTFLVTARRNVPLNDQLEKVVPEAGAELWSKYLRHWVFWNHIRTTAAMLAAFCFTMGLIQL
jgi:uncharacterized membrane protein